MLPLFDSGLRILILRFLKAASAQLLQCFIRQLPEPLGRPGTCRHSSGCYRISPGTCNDLIGAMARRNILEEAALCYSYIFARTSMTKLKARRIPRFWYMAIAQEMDRKRFPPCALTSAPSLSSSSTILSWPPSDAIWSALPYFPPSALTSAPSPSSSSTIFVVASYRCYLKRIAVLSALRVDVVAFAE